MTEIQGVHLFFESFESHLNQIISEQDLGPIARRAQVMKTQLALFKDACLQLHKSPMDQDLVRMDKLVGIKDVVSFFDWLLKGQALASVETCFYRKNLRQWQALHETTAELPKLEDIQWLEKGRIGVIEPEGETSYCIFLAGEARLVFQARIHYNVPKNACLKLIEFLFSSTAEPLGSYTKPSVNQSYLIAHDEKSIQLLEKLRNAAQTDVTVLLEGESGTGKEVLANFIHQNSRRKKDEFVAVNCAAIPEGLIESELFGHEKGAFTGAVKRHIGKVEAANGGTLFLDEIGEMDLKVQAKLLRFLQLKEFHRVGGKEKISVDVRIVAATNRDLRRAIEEQTFRDDLFFRLSVMPFKIHPLRDRPGDLVPLFHFFLKRYAREFEFPLPQVSPFVYEALYAHPFKGNIRELENLVQNVLVQSQGKRITKDHLPTSFWEGFEGADKEDRKTVLRALEDPNRCVGGQAQGDASVLKRPEVMPQNNEELKAAKQQIMDQARDMQNQLEREFLVQLLEETNWVINDAAKRSGINRTMFYKMMDRTGLKA